VFQCCTQQSTESCHIACCSHRAGALSLPTRHVARLFLRPLLWSAFFLLVTPNQPSLYGCQWFRRDDFSRASITPHSPIRRGKREVREVGRGSRKVGGGSYNSGLFALGLCACLAIQRFLCVPFGCSSGQPPPPKAFHTTTVDVTTFLPPPPQQPLPPVESLTIFLSLKVFSPDR
jgi:hypothetical protein